MSSPKRWNDASFPEIDFADILDSEEIGIVNDAGSQKVYKKGTLIADLATLYQAFDDLLTAIAALSPSGNTLVAVGAGDTAELITLESWAETMLSAASADAAGLLDKTTSQVISAVRYNTGNQAFGFGSGTISYPMTLRAASATAAPFGFQNIDAVAIGFFYSNAKSGELYLRDSTSTNKVKFSSVGDSFHEANLKLGATSAAAQKLDVVGHIKASGVLSSVGYTVAGLPTAGLNDGAHTFASNGRKQGEGVGVGTGVPCYLDGGVWYRYSDDTAVAA